MPFILSLWEANIVSKQEIEQLQKVYDILHTTLKDFISNIVDFDRLKIKVTEIRERTSQVIPLVPKNFRASSLILRSLQNLNFFADCIDTSLSSETPQSTVTYYWVGRCISTLSDILITINCVVDRGGEEP
jgi:hypothetical protein